MHSFSTVPVQAPPARAFEFSLDLLRWPGHLPHYRPIPPLVERVIDFGIVRPVTTKTPATIKRLLESK